MKNFERESQKVGCENHVRRRSLNWAGVVLPMCWVHQIEYNRSEVKPVMMKKDTTTASTSSGLTGKKEVVVGMVQLTPSHPSLHSHWYPVFQKFLLRALVISKNYYWQIKY